MIYNRQTIALLMRLCKLVSGEFGVRLHLNDPDILSKISELLAGGASPEAQTVWRAIRDEVGQAELPPVAIGERRVYAGQSSAQSARAVSVASEMEPPPSTRTRSVRIYRGRIVN